MQVTTGERVDPHGLELKEKVAAAGVALLIALVPVSFRAIRAANANPINNLRSE